MTTQAQSWKDPEVRRRRLEKHSVTVSVNGGLPRAHSSAHSAFKYYGLPDKMAIRFRLVVKMNGSARFEHNGNNFDFVLIEKIL